MPSSMPKTLEMPNHPTVKDQVRTLAQRCAAYAKADANRASLQLVTTLLPLLAIVALMFACVHDAYWLTLLLAIPAGGLVVRLFIIQHDCGHGSFLASQDANDRVGRFVSLFTMTPYGLWKREHALHHATSGNLDKRGIGDITTLTVKEYRALPLPKRINYRIYRNPLFLFAIGIPCYFLILQRLPWWHGLPARDTWKSVLALDLAMLLVYGPLAFAVGISSLLLVTVPMIVVAAAAGGWLFFIQHQFDEVYWERSGRWDFQTAAVLGSSYYALPAVINWFTGHIGLHHIHHLASKIPNYRLRECLDGIPEFKSLNRLTLLDSLKCARLKLWDEDTRRLVGFADVR
jgi:omega-6 fatty acid desaturase (delta-12 desaturase)